MYSCLRERAQSENGLAITRRNRDISATFGNQLAVKEGKEKEVRTTAEEESETVNHGPQLTGSYPALNKRSASAGPTTQYSG